ncbi:Disease resistance protein (TIR-NBS-LRR class) family [Euphorbia peplus]|nr:Disease resistance protein (TIR-NBS-LRR class) family [Euphorbia peplus]
MATPSSSSSSSSPCTYHVFLSFRGADTRKNFTDHLYTSLTQSGIHTFRDDDEIVRGELIESEITKAIQQSTISVVVLSRDYASSRWCLDELAMIMERKRSDGHLVVPVFYDVDPILVRDQSGVYGEAFGRHEVEFGEKMVEGWRRALREVADMVGGMVLRDRYQSQFIQNVVKEVGNKLNRVVLNVAPYLVGIDSRIVNINSWLQDGSNDVGVAAIYGAGGIGKTTLAKIIFNQNQNFERFDGSSFLANVREASEQPDGFVRLQKKLLSDISKGKTQKIYNVDEGITKIKNVISRRRVFLVLDDVDQLEQYNALIGMKEWFCPGSKIIITTRHERLLKPREVKRMFRVDELNDIESLQLFSWHAFAQEHPFEDFQEQTVRSVSLCGGLPLALQVLGSSLSGKSIEVWESALRKLEAIPDSKIQAILKVSYDSLEDDHDKNVFLDIACFFTGKDKAYVISILEGCKLYAVVGINNLLGRCLLTINEDSKLMMHLLIRDMGREIVRQEAPDDPGKRSRLWRHRDAFDVLSENSGTEAVKGLTLNLQMLNKEVIGDEFVVPRVGNYSRKPFFHFLSRQPEVNLKARAFEKIRRLKLLQLNHVKFGGEYRDFPKGLVWLFWRGFSLRHLPSDLRLEKLVVLDIRNSSLINLWKGTRLFPTLKILVLSHSHGLVRTPDFEGLPSLEILKLKGCINLLEVDESIGYLQRLVILNLKDCRNLKRLPREIGLLASLERLNLCGCSKLDELPEEIRQMQSLKVLYADGTALTQMQPVHSQRTSVFRSWLSPRKNPQSITFSLGILPIHLVNLSLADCNLLDTAIPYDLSCLQSLEFLDLKGNPLRTIPESINSLTTLLYLRLDQCESLRSLPELPTSLEELRAEGCTSLERITTLPNLLTTLWVELFGCDQLVEVQDLFKLESIMNIDEQTMNNLGIDNLAPFGDTEITLFNAMANRERITTPQVLQECGILSFFIAWSDIPCCFAHRTTGSSLSFTITPSPGHTIHGLNLCAVYARDKQVFWLHAAGHYAKIKNETQGVIWSYSPTFYGIPEENEDMLWLSYWKFGDDFRVGDEMDVSVCMPPGFYVKECGIRVLYEADDEKDMALRSEGISESSSVWEKRISERDLSRYQVEKNVYFLHHHPFTTPDEILN